MEKSVAKVRGFVIDLLKKNKALTEREVKAAIGRAFKLNPKTISAGVIRDVRKKLGIDRPGAIAFAKALLDKNPVLEAKKVIEEVGTRFGVRLGAPDVSRLRPVGPGGAAARAAPTASRCGVRSERPQGGLDLGDLPGQRPPGGPRGLLPFARGGLRRRLAGGQGFEPR